MSRTPSPPGCIAPARWVATFPSRSCIAPPPEVPEAHSGNFGITTFFWDKLFRTYYDRADRKAKSPTVIGSDQSGTLTGRALQPRLHADVAESGGWRSSRAGCGQARRAVSGSEDELNGLTAAGGYVGAERSPDRADAMVWALTELIAKPAPEPHVRLF